MSGNVSCKSIPTKKYIQTGIASLLVLFVISWFATGVWAETKPSIHTTYHVYINNQHIGSVLDDQPIYFYIEEFMQAAEEIYPGWTLQVAEKVKIIPEFVLREGKDDEQVLPILKEELTIQAEATALLIESDPVVYLSSEKEASQVLERLMKQYIGEKEYEQFLEGTDETIIEIGETILTDISLSEEVTKEKVFVSPDQITSVDHALKKLNKGILEETPYLVKEGDVLGSIAYEHGLTTDRLIEMNQDLEVDRVIRVGQELQVMVYEPLLEVLSTYLSKAEEEIAFETEVREDDSMWKGDKEVTQEGELGSRVVKYETVEKNGATLRREVLSEEVTKEPVNQIIVKGTKEMPSRGSGQLSWPAVGGYISSYQGSRWGRFHKGIDIARPSNYSILAADNGVVTSASYQGGYGNLVRINHNNGMETVYAHLASMDVSVGETVAQGQRIGVMGATGNSTGIHLHFEVYQNGQLKNPMDFLK